MAGATADCVISWKRALDEFLRRYVVRVLAKHNGNVTRAAAASGIARRYFYVVKNRSRK